MKRVLTIAGSDSGGGAGIQADIKTITVLGAHAMTAVTALTAQNTRRIHAIHPVPPAFVQRQMEAVLEDIGADAVKTGMLGSAEVVHVVADTLRRYRVEQLVVDPVMVAKTGDELLSASAQQVLVSELFPLALLVTPNLPEASSLCGSPVDTPARMKEAARTIAGMGPRHVLIKGGHLPGDPFDVLYDGSRYHILSGPRVRSRHTHGTGCTYASAIATFLARGFSVTDAVARARSFVVKAIEGGLALGPGQGPTNPYAWLEGRLAQPDVP